MVLSESAFLFCVFSAFWDISYMGFSRLAESIRNSQDWSTLADEKTIWLTDSQETYNNSCSRFDFFSFLLFGIILTYWKDNIYINKLKAKNIQLRQKCCLSKINASKQRELQQGPHQLQRMAPVANCLIEMRQMMFQKLSQHKQKYAHLEIQI